MYCLTPNMYNVLYIFCIIFSTVLTVLDAPVTVVLVVVPVTVLHPQVVLPPLPCEVLQGCLPHVGCLHLPLRHHLGVTCHLVANCALYLIVAVLHSIAGPGAEQ